MNYLLYHSPGRLFLLLYFFVSIHFFECTWATLSAVQMASAFVCAVCVDTTKVNFRCLVISRIRDRLLIIKIGKPSSFLVLLARTASSHRPMCIFFFLYDFHNFISRLKNNNQLYYNKYSRKLCKTFGQFFVSFVLHIHWTFVVSTVCGVHWRRPSESERKNRSYLVSLWTDLLCFLWLFIQKLLLRHIFIVLNYRPLFLLRCFWTFFSWVFFFRSGCFYNSSFLIHK